MDHSSHVHLARCHGLPRASGDGPLFYETEYDRETAAPRERGWTRKEARLDGATFGCPARAGMDPPQSPSPPAASWLPRASGDGPMVFSFRELIS